MGAVSLKHQKSENLSLNYFISTFNTNETEYFDLLGEYRLDELEREIWEVINMEILRTIEVLEHF